MPSVSLSVKTDGNRTAGRITLAHGTFRDSWFAKPQGRRLCSALADAALSYAQSGFHVFPVWNVTGNRCGCGAFPCGDDNKTAGKHPMQSLVPAGKDNATSDPAQIAHWWQLAPDANIGIATAPSGLVILDVDVSKQKRGRESLAEIDSQLDDTLTSITGSGGLHAYYLRAPDIEPFSRIDARPGLDIVGNGYVIAPPSMHLSGNRYRWINVRPIVQMPRILRELKKERPDRIHKDEVGAPITEGGRNNAMFKLGAAIRATGIDYNAVRAALHMENARRFQPPLPDDEVDQIAIKVMRHARVDRDVAASAIVADEIRDLLGKPDTEIALWIRDVASKPRRPMRFYSTGNLQLDALLGGGIATSHVCGIIGPPSVGKSAFVGSLCMQLQTEVPILSVSTELSRYELMVRIAALRKGFPWRDAMKGSHDALLLESVRDLRLKLIGSDELDTNDPIGCITRQALDMQNETGQMPGIVIDYVQLLARGGEDGMRARVGELTLKIRKLAQILDTFIIAVFSTSREYYGGDRMEKLRILNDPTAYLKAAKESGDIEFDCATILFLDVDQLAQGLPKPSRAVVARCRVGEVGFAGYRAHLDTGLWLPDPLAASEFVNGGARKQEQKTAVMHTDEQLVLQTVARLQGRQWAELRDLCGISRDRAQAAKMRLLSSGDLVDVAETTYDDDTHRKHTRHIIRLGNRTGNTGV